MSLCTFFVEVCEVVPLLHVAGDGRAGVPAVEVEVGSAQVEVGEGEHLVELHVDLLQDQEHLLVHRIELKIAKFGMYTVFVAIRK